MRQGLLSALGVCLLSSSSVLGAAPKTRLEQPRPLPAASSTRSLPTSQALSPSAADGWALASDDGGIGVAMASDVPTPAAGSGISAPVASEPDSQPAMTDYGGYSDSYSGSVGCADADGACYGDSCYGGDSCYTGGYDCGMEGCCGASCGSRFWAQVDYLYWWEKGKNLPTLVSTSPVGTPVNQAGVLTSDFRGNNTASVLVGRRDLEIGPQSGGRVKFGQWVDDCQRTMVGGEFFMLQTEVGVFRTNSDQTPIIARPFLNAGANNSPSSVLISYPNQAAGQIKVSTETDVTGGGAFLRRGLTGFRDARIDMLWGYRFLRMDDVLRVDDFTTVTGSGSGRPAAVGSTIQCFDEFEARNEFHGGEVGLMLDLPVTCRVRVSMLGKCAFGPVEQLMYIRGGTVTTAGTTVGTFEGSVLTQETNLGLYRQRELAVLPEAQFNLSVQATQHIRGVLGYTFMYLNTVQRAADAVDTTVHEDLFTDTPVANPGGPLFAFNDTDFWLQGLNFGVDISF